MSDELDPTIGEVIARSMKREPQPSVHTAWEGDERTEAAYLDGWRSARDWYAIVIERGWPYEDPCPLAQCYLQRGHTGDHIDKHEEEVECERCKGKGWIGRDPGLTDGWSRPCPDCQKEGWPSDELARNVFDAVLESDATRIIGSDIPLELVKRAMRGEYPEPDPYQKWSVECFRDDNSDPWTAELLDDEGFVRAIFFEEEEEDARARAEQELDNRREEAKNA